MKKYFVLFALLCSSAVAQHRTITAADAAQIEANLQKDPDDIRRVVLVAYYAEQNDREARLRHLYWLIEHHPEWPGTSAATLTPGADYERAKQLWLNQVQARGTEMPVLINAGKFFDDADPALALEQYRKAYTQFPKDRLAISTLSQKYAQILDAPDRFDPFVVRTVNEDLTASTDPQLLWWTGSMIRHQDELGAKLKARAKAIDPYVEPRPQTSSNGPSFPETPGVKRIRIGGNVQAANLKTFEPAVYPPFAKQARIQGTVRFQALIATDGTVKALELVSGHPLLVPAAQDAVKKWVYQITLLNGEPVEVVSPVDVVFSLNP